LFQNRWAQSLVLGAWTYKQDPSNDYVLTTAKNGGWRILTQFWKDTTDEDLMKEWQKIADEKL